MKNHLGRTLEERFNEKWTPEPFSGCWLWTGSVNRQGYGYFRLGRKMHKAHRIAWLIFNGDFLEKSLVCHKCDTPSCVNPAHLFLGNHTDNIVDSLKKGRRDQHRGSGRDWTEVREIKGEKRNQCSRGHPFSGSNLYINKSGYAICRACSRLSYIRRRKELGQPVVIT